MKTSKLIVFMIALVLSSGTMMAQGKGAKRKARRAKIKAAKIKFIKKELQLSPAESQPFWNAYNANEDKREALYEKHKAIHKKYKGRAVEDLTDAEAGEMVNSRMELKESMLQLDREFLEEIKRILPIKKVAKYYAAEKKFKRKMLRKMRRHGPPNRRGGPGGHSGGHPGGHPGGDLPPPDFE